MNLGLFDFLKGRKPSVTITSINIKLHGYMHSMKGMTASDNPFALEIPFTNKTHTDMLTEAASFKAQKSEPIKINGIEISEPFRLISVEPRPPLEVKADEKITFKMSIGAPNHSFNGPMNISFITDSVEMVHIEISKAILEAKGRTTEIESSSRILNLPKGQIFTEKIQLYKAFSYGDEVNSIKIVEPFEFVSSEPKLPVEIDDPNSYILNIYIKAPPTSYAGKLEIKLS